jgi:hypothetical protein
MVDASVISFDILLIIYFCPSIPMWCLQFHLMFADFMVLNLVVS